MSRDQTTKIVKIIKKDYKKARERSQSVSKEQKVKKQQYDHERYKNLPQDEERKMKKMPHYNYKKLLF